MQCGAQKLCSQEEIRTLIGNLMPRISGNISAMRITFSIGSFNARIDGKLPRSLNGVILQGEGIHRGLGSVADANDIGSFELLSVPAAPADGN